MKSISEILKFDSNYYLSFLWPVIVLFDRQFQQYLVASLQALQGGGYPFFFNLSVAGMLRRKFIKF
jgi:hypothetical protein